jgi:ubiquinone/menaquinone biosynthesis C-methylase UbiE
MGSIGSTTEKHGALQMEENENQPTGAGKSSFDLIDSEKFFNELNLQKGISFLDVASGKGAYSLAVSDIIGPKGSVFAVDLWAEGIEMLKAAAEERGVDNITTFVSDVSRNIPVQDRSVDVCLIATALHDFVEDRIDQGVLTEIARVVKPTGILAVMEFKKIDGPPGPPMHIRLSPAEVADRLAPYGFEKERSVDVGPYNYLIMLKKIKNNN